jgi:hypothetical protein
MNQGRFLSHHGASHFVWAAALASVWFLIDYPTGLGIFVMGAIAHRIVHG